jgi:hypothetical protein
MDAAESILLSDWSMYCEFDGICITIVIEIYVTDELFINGHGAAEFHCCPYSDLDYKCRSWCSIR